jgi:uncharacterized membrane protein YkoI
MLGGTRSALSYFQIRSIDSAKHWLKEVKVHVKKAFLAVAVAMVVLLGAGVAYPTNGSSEATPGDDDWDDSYKGSVSAPGQSESSLRELANIDQTAAEQAALKAVPGTVHKTELETSDNDYLVYDIEVAGKDGKISVPRSLDTTHVLASIRA